MLANDIVGGTRKPKKQPKNTTRDTVVISAPQNSQENSMRRIRIIGKRLVNRLERCYLERKSGNRRGRRWEGREMLLWSRRVLAGIIRGSQEMQRFILGRAEERFWAQESEMLGQETGMRREAVP